MPDSTVLTSVTTSSNGLPATTITFPVTTISSTSNGPENGGAGGTASQDQPVPTTQPKSSSSSVTSQTTSSTSGITSSTGPLSTTSATTPTSSPSVEGGNGGYSGGSLAGAAIGCLIAGLLLGAVAAFFWLRRRKQNDSMSSVEYMPMQRPDKGYDDKMIPPPTMPVLPVTSGIQLNQFLLAPKPDSEIVGELRARGHLIQQHVEDNYHALPVQGDMKTMAQGLVNLGIPAHEADALTKLACAPNKRLPVLQHIIALAVLGGATLDTGMRYSMLPLSVAEFQREMPPVEKHMGSQEAMATAFTRWRQLSAFLLNAKRSERSALVPTESHQLHEQAQALVQALNAFLAGFVDQTRGADQEHHLHQVVLECATFGYLLFSQPADFRLTFDNGRAIDSIVVCPGLEKVGDEQGIRSRQPQLLLQPAAVPI